MSTPAIPAVTAGASPSVNVFDAVYCTLTESSGTWSYGSVARLATLRSVNADTPENSTEYYGDGVLEGTKTTMDKTTLKLEFNGLADSVRSALLGYTYDSSTKKVTVSSSASKPYVAVGFAIENEDGTYKGYWFVKGKVSESALDAKQRESNVTFSTTTLTGTFIDYSVSNPKRYISISGTKSEVETFLASAPVV